MASRILGFARDMLIASRLGAGPVADAFFVALKLPNLFRRLFGEGAFNAAFVPAFAGILAAEGRAAARDMADRMGALMMHFMLETIVAADLMGVDPFDQPAVEEGKVLARKYLAAMGPAAPATAPPAMAGIKNA